MKTPPMRDSTQEQPPHLVFFSIHVSQPPPPPPPLHPPLHTPNPLLLSPTCFGFAQKRPASTRRAREKVRHSPVCSSQCERTCMSACVMQSDSREMQRCGSVVLLLFFFPFGSVLFVATKPFSPCGELSKINPLTLKEQLAL